MGRILAIDCGQKRIGLAVTDNLQMIASGLTTIMAHEALTFLSNYLKNEKVDLFVVGKPKQMDNSDSESMKYVVAFKNMLSNHFPNIPVEEIDERFTSKMAFQTMIDSGIKKKERQNKALIDTISATIILQSYLEKLSFKK